MCVKLTDSNWIQRLKAEIAWALTRYHRAKYSNKTAKSTAKCCHFWMWTAMPFQSAVCVQCSINTHSSTRFTAFQMFDTLTCTQTHTRTRSRTVTSDINRVEKQEQRKKENIWQKQRACVCFGLLLQILKSIYTCKQYYFDLFLFVFVFLFRCCVRLWMNYFYGCLFANHI